jgi:hypothetical protein
VGGRRSHKHIAIKGTRLYVSGNQEKLLELLAKGQTVAQSWEEAGYAFQQSAYEAIKKLRMRFPDILERLDYGAHRAMRKLIEMTDANETKFFQKDGEVTDEREVADNGTRLGARIELAKIHGAYPRNNGNGSHSPSEGMGGLTINLAFSSRGAAESVAKAIPQRIVGGRQLVVDAPGDADERRSGPAEPLQALSTEPEIPRRTP